MSEPVGVVIDLEKVPIELSRRGLLALFASGNLADRQTGEVRGGVWGLVEVLDQLYTSIDGAVAECESHHLLRRLGSRSEGKRLFVSFQLFSPPSRNNARTCEGCLKELPESTRNSARWCDDCRQTLGRVDRAWQSKAIALVVAGKEPSEISQALRQPLWVRDVEDNQTSAVVPFLLAEGLIGDEWRDALEEVVGAEKANALVKGAGLRTGRRS